VKFMNRKLGAFLLLCALTQGFAQGSKPGLKAWVEHSPVGLNQRFTLFVEMSGKGSQSAQPEVPSLNDWAAFLGSGSSQNMQIVNGAMSVSKTIHYQYQTQKAGTFSIPPIKVNIGGKNYSVNPIKVIVDKSATPTSNRPSQRSRNRSESVDISSDDLFVQVKASKATVYVNEPLVLTYTIYTRLNVSSYEFAQMPATAGFWVEEINQGQRPSTRTEVIDGKRYTAATIKKTLMFPMSAGEKTIDPLVLRCAVRVKSRSRSVFDDFFNDRTISHNISSDPVTVAVRPLPSVNQPKGFNGQVGQYQVKATVDKRQLKTNEAVTYRLIISGEGNLRGLATPEPRFPDGFEVYPPEVKEVLNRDGGTVSGSKTFEWLLVPRSAGRQVIPRYQLSYFDPQSQMYRTATAGEIALQVRRGGDGLVENAPALRSRQSVALLGRDIRYIKTDGLSLKHSSSSFPVWLWVYLLGLPLLLILPAFSVRRHQERLAGDVAFARRRRASRLAKRHLAKARPLLTVERQKAYYAEIGHAVTGFIGDKLNLSTAGLMSETVRRALTEKGVKDETVESVMTLLAQCDRMRFAPAASDESEMNQVYQLAETVLNRLDRELS